MSPTYIVSGFWRSGTSMMMHALKAGGMAVVGEADPLRMNERYAKPDGYRPNPNGFYQFTGDPADVRQHAGRAVKLPWHQAETIPPGDYRVAFMLRDPAEIRESWRIMLGDRVDAIDAGDWGRDFRNYHGAVRRVKEAMERAGASVHCLHYAEVVSNPVGAFGELSSLGWPVDVASAAAAVDPNLYRARV